MIRDITIGQYYPMDSIIHKLDPRVKLFATLIYIIALFSCKGIVGLIVITFFLATAVKLSKIPFLYITKGLKTIVMLLLVTTIFNLFLTPGKVTFWHYGILKITDVGITNAVVMTVRLIYLIIGTSLMSLTTTPNQLTDGLEKSLSPLSKIHVPVHAIAMMMSIALRFIPILVEETDKIMKAQMARGADFESGNIIKRAKNMIPLLVPLMVSAFRRADELAMAMEARCYTATEGRSKMKPLHYEKRDKIAYVIIISFLVIVVAAGIVIPYPQ
ncbi:energy-coupling factor transporter transmembrane component T family protein [Lachnobacterium bovis]|uniref:Energy-coupling factor transport system permease protein n=1 Tax=Lachnobacterium bovis TaxID=140626 RepID=A0A1H9TKP2_9FIRM|nr:energy-coupling factor transporter transmembrane component T [Lachnobacterium bovis]SER97183.1 energy-coupling factor transport system permease protein [Lachnobacterium bovis]